MKYNDKSRFFKEWTTKKLKNEAISYYDMIYNLECYGVKDVMALEGITAELNERGIEDFTTLAFKD